ncbi:MAG: UpxY family transcription antiterminator [Candidatus Acidiferrales bacterium]
MFSEQNTPHWYAAYTLSRHEKTTAKHFGQRAIEHFVPTYESVHFWKDRRKRITAPLFPGYVFVRVPLQDKLSVLVVPGVVRLVGFENRPVAVPDEEIAALRNIVAHGLNAEPHPYLVTGCKARLTRGPLEGMRGVLIRKKGRLRLLLSVDLIRQAATIEVDAADVEPL